MQRNATQRIIAQHNPRNAMQPFHSQALSDQQISHSESDSDTAQNLPQTRQSNAACTAAWLAWVQACVLVILIVSPLTLISDVLIMPQSRTIPAPRHIHTRLYPCPPAHTHYPCPAAHTRTIVSLPPGAYTLSLPPGTYTYDCIAVLVWTGLPHFNTVK